MMKSFLYLLPAALSVVASPLPVAENIPSAEPLEVRQSTQSETGCTAMTVIFARGTTETGNVGTVAGPPFFNALNDMIGADAVTVQGVPYPANVQGFLAGGDKAGSQTMADMVQSALSTCPDTKLVMAGYSQGGQLVHNAAKLMPASVMSQVSSAVIFGDPDNGDPVAGVSAANTKVICHTGDNICAGGSLILMPHLTYGRDGKDAATFAVGAAGLKKRK